MRFLDRIFKLETISGAGICPVYLHRWTLLRLGRWCKVYLHHFSANDWSVDYHNHPKRFTVFGLWGGYTEHVYNPVTRKVRRQRFRAPWVRTFPPSHAHRIVMEEYEHAWTLVVIGPTRQEWGFYRTDRAGIWIPWRRYVYGPHGAARKDC